MLEREPIRSSVSYEKLSLRLRARPAAHPGGGGVALDPLGVVLRWSCGVVVPAPDPSEDLGGEI